MRIVSVSDLRTWASRTCVYPAAALTCKGSNRTSSRRFVVGVFADVLIRERRGTTERGDVTEDRAIVSEKGDASLPTEVSSNKCNRENAGNCSEIGVTGTITTKATFFL